jgi:hypothetical protein
MERNLFKVGHDDLANDRLGDNLCLTKCGAYSGPAWELLARTESEGDYRGSVVALRECLESLGEMLAKGQHCKRGGRWIIS